MLATNGVQGIIKVVIAAEAALSGEIDISGYRNLALQMPAAWTAANITFQGATERGGAYQNIYDSAGNELSVIAAASRAITDIPELAPFRFIKIRSGTTGTPVNQAAARTIEIIAKG